MAIPKIEKVRRKLRELIPTWMKSEGRPPTMEEFLSEYRMRDDLHSSEYSKAKNQVMEEMGYAGENNVANVPVKNMADANKAAEGRLAKAVKHLLPVMERDRLEEVTVIFDADSGTAKLEFQAAPPPRQKVDL